MMIEEKLLQAAQELPEAPECFEEIVMRAQKRKKCHPHFRIVSKKVAIACVFAFLLTCGTVFAATTEAKYIGLPEESSYDFKSVQRTADEMDITLPETLGKYSFESFSTCHVVPDGTSYLEVLLGAPSYLWHGISYSIGGSREFSDSAPFSLYIGSTKDELYKYVFYFDNNDIWNSEYLLPDTYHSEIYNGILLQSGITKYEQKSSFYEIIWIDDTHKAVFSIHYSIDDEQNLDHIKDQAINYAKNIIDSNIITSKK